MSENQIYFIVDDDADDIDFFCEAINEIDAHAICHIARNGEEALELLHMLVGGGLPDFIFLDLNMPRMDGKTCLSELKKDADLKDVPVIIYTTSTHQKDKEETLRLGADYFLSKPTSFKALCEGICKAMEAIRRSKELG